MENKYLNEEKYQESKKKISLVGTILLCAGGLLMLTGIILLANRNFAGGFMLVFGFGLIGFGMVTKVMGHGREINAFMMQQNIPIMKETAETIAPTARKIAKETMDDLSPSVGNMAKEITKGIKEGLKDEK